MAKNEQGKIRSLIDSMKLDEAEEMLKENLESDNKDTSTYDMLIEVYQGKGDYQGLIKLLNKAIKFSGDKEKYRQIRKKLILDKIMTDINDLDE